MLVALLRVLQVPRAACGVVVIPLIWFYTMATGWQASAIRATIMMTIVVLGWALRRPSDLLNSLIASATVILVWDPRQVFQASFQLSFFVVLSMALLLPPLERLRDRLLRRDPLLPEELLPRWRRWLEPPVRWATLNLGVALAAWVGSLPLVAHYFHLVTPVSLLVNMLVVPLSSLALMCNLGALAAGAWWPGLAEAFNHSAWFWMAGAVGVCEWAAGMPGAWFHSASPGAARLLFWYALLVWSSGRWFTRPAWRWGSLGVIGILGLAWLAESGRQRSAATLTVLETRRGGVVWVDPAGHQADLLVDCGDETDAGFTTKPFLQARGINQLRRVAFTHGDIRHVGGWRILDEAFRVREVGLGATPFRSPAYRELAARFTSAGTARRLVAGTNWHGWRVLHPPATNTFSLADDNCLVLAGELDHTRVLLLGDLGPLGQRALAEREPELRADIIVAGAPTRGEPVGAALVETARPELIILDDADPAAPVAPPEYVQRWRDRGIRVLRTAEHGTVTVRFAAAGWQAQGMKGPLVTGTRPQ
jgi:ComEC/Rec2-related protein